MIFVMLMGLAACLTQLAILDILRYNHTIAVMATTLKKSAKDSLNSFVCVMVVLTAFAGYMHIAYGKHMQEYSSMPRTYLAEISAFMGVFDYVGVYEATGALGAAMLIVYLMNINHIFINLFVTMLSNYISAIRADPRAVPNDHEVIKHMMCMIQDTIGIESDEVKERRRIAEKISKTRLELHLRNSAKFCN